jgi:hypothetical protein
MGVVSCGGKAESESVSSDGGIGDAAANPNCFTQGAPACNTSVLLGGDPASCARDSNGQATAEQCAALCNGNDHCLLSAVSPQGATVECQCIMNTGRAPAGLREPQVDEASLLGAHFARMAYLEAASVTAFATLVRELAEHGAPAPLLSAARRAARDEVRHARSMKAVARRFGTEVPEVQVEPLASRSLEEIALENEVEGCVRETFGAAVAAYQGAAARDARIRRAMRTIARDEKRHAELGWEVSRWAASRLDGPARARVRAARDAAVREVMAAAGQEPPAPLKELAGLPTVSHAKRLVESLCESLWSGEGPDAALRDLYVA